MATSLTFLALLLVLVSSDCGELNSYATDELLSQDIQMFNFECMSQLLEANYFESASLLIANTDILNLQITLDLMKEGMAKSNDKYEKLLQ